MVSFGSAEVCILSAPEVEDACVPQYCPVICVVKRVWSANRETNGEVGGMTVVVLAE